MNRKTQGRAQDRANIEWGGERLNLLASGAVWWERTRTVIVADTHFGKAAFFRKRGVPVPSGPTQSGVMKLNELVEEHDAARVLVLGDLLHGEGLSAGVMDMLIVLLETKPKLELLIVRGNHDVHAGDLPEHPAVKYVNEHAEGRVVFKHIAEMNSHGFEMAGHMHPVVSMRSETGSRVRAKCFWVGKNSMVLPAFGDFTGGATIAGREGDRVFAICEDEIAEVPTVVRQRRSAASREATRTKEVRVEVVTRLPSVEQAAGRQ